ncbi:MAG TPA: hypothetical protein VHO24_02010 [Opitutaceae bacterium]|nr:hypothetical protein [Opitutaceae bacterium]
MKIKSSLPSLLASAALLLGVSSMTPPLRADHHETKPAPAAKVGKLIKVTEKDSAWATQARKDYPLEVCVASDEKLGGMGKPAEFIYRVEGQPDRLVRFCCGGCDEDFMKDPAKHLAKIDAAGKGKSAPDAPKAHGDHK